MAKRGRKPKSERTGYFYEQEEEAFVKYLNSEDNREREEIYNKYLHPAFVKMIESIIRRYNLYPPDECFQETFDDTLSFLMSKIEKFNPNSGYKAYSYCGTICKNYLLYKINLFSKNQKRNESYDLTSSEIDDSIKYSYYQDADRISLLNDIINEMSKEIKKMIERKNELKLNENQIKVGEALIELFDNWEDMFMKMGSNKFNKSSILLFLKEITLLSPKEIRDGMKIFKNKYGILKKEIIEI